MAIGHLNYKSMAIGHLNYKSMATGHLKYWVVRKVFSLNL